MAFTLCWNTCTVLWQQFCTLLYFMLYNHVHCTGQWMIWSINHCQVPGSQYSLLEWTILVVPWNSCKINTISWFHLHVAFFSLFYSAHTKTVIQLIRMYLHNHLYHDLFKISLYLQVSIRPNNLIPGSTLVKIWWVSQFPHSFSLALDDQ